MNIILYVLIFIMGTVFGSFLTLATYRIPLNKDITHERSFCPNCNHRLEFLDLIPLLSYIFLRGKCRYCKKKISPRYFIIELSCGLSFLLLAFILKIDIYAIDAYTIANFVIGALYIVFIFLVAGIDLEHGTIDGRTLIYGMVIAIINIIYQFVGNKGNNPYFGLARVVYYFIALIIICIINIRKINKKLNYNLSLMIICIIINLFTYEVCTFLTIIFTLLIISFKLLINKTVNKGEKYEKKMPVAFYLGLSNQIMLLLAFLYSLV